MPFKMTPNLQVEFGTHYFPNHVRNVRKSSSFITAHAVKKVPEFSA